MIDFIQIDSVLSKTGLNNGILVWPQREVTHLSSSMAHIGHPGEAAFYHPRSVGHFY